MSVIFDRTVRQSGIFIRFIYYTTKSTGFQQLFLIIDRYMCYYMSSVR